MMPAIPPGDVLLHAGDFSSTGTLPEVTRFRQFMESQPHPQKIVIAGNHDITLQPDYYKVFGVNFHGKFFRKPDFDPLEYAQQCRDVVCPSTSPAYTYLQDSSTTILPPVAGSTVLSEGIQVYGSPWQPEFFNWAFNLYPGAELKEKWDMIPDTTDVLITHGPPRMILDRVDDGTFTGCAQLRDAIAQRVKPRLHVFGHIHEGYGRNRHVTLVLRSPCSLIPRVLSYVHRHVLRRHDYLRQCVHLHGQLPPHQPSNCGGSAFGPILASSGGGLPNCVHRWKLNSMGLSLKVVRKNRRYGCNLMLFALLFGA